MSRPLSLLRLAGLVLLPISGAACDSTSPPEHSHSTIAVLNAFAAFNDSSLGRQHYCTLSGSWSLPAWPSLAQADSATLYFARELVPASAAAVRRDTVLQNVTITWTRFDSTHLHLTLGPPLASALDGTLDSANGRVLTAGWSCPASLPFGSDSVLLANGYEADSLGHGVLHVSRMYPID